MTQEEKFKEAKRLYETANADQRYVLESLFPELRESEDERIRKELIKVFTNRKEWVKNQSFGDITVSDILAWLEKQAQKPAAWSEDDEKVLHAIKNALNYEKPRNYLKSRDFEFTDILDWLKSLKDRVQPQSQWKPSEREKEALLWCVVHLGGADKQTLGELLEELNKL